MTAPGFCWGCWHPPSGPGTPFQGALLAPDLIRAISLVLVVVGIVMLIRAIQVTTNFPQRMRFGCLLLFTLLITSILIEHLGDTGNWRTGFILAVLIWQAQSVWAYLCDIHPEATPRLPRRRPRDR